MFISKLFLLVLVVLIHNKMNVYGDARVQSSIAMHPNLSLLPKSCGEMNEDRIIPGKFAKLYNFPWMALIAYETRDGRVFNCTGTVISSKYILTAAYCVYNKNHIVGVRIGEHDLQQDVDCEGEQEAIFCESYLQDIDIDQHIVHEDYDGKMLNDIALLRLKKPINFTDNAQPLCLPATEELLVASIIDEQALITGWALSTEKPTVLRRDYVDVINLSTSDISKSKVLNKLIAAGAGRNGCVIDNGGPLITASKYIDYKRYVQYGIFLFGPTLCETEKPSVYTNVSKYMNWILNNIKG